MSSSGSSLGFWLNRLLLGNITDIQIWMPFPIFCFRLYNKIPPAGIFQIFVPEPWCIVAHKYNIRNTQVQNEKDTHGISQDQIICCFFVFPSSSDDYLFTGDKILPLPLHFFSSWRLEWDARTRCHDPITLIVIIYYCDYFCLFFFCTDVVLSLITHNHTMV